MDPDMVRQQEEEEYASRLRGPVKVTMPASRQPIPEPPIVLRAAPRDHDPSSRLIRPHLPAPSPAPAWGTALRASLSSLIWAGAGLLGGIMLGVKLGLIPEQSLAIGTGAGYLLGWQAMAVSLRRPSALTLGRAIATAVLPSAIILLSLIASMALAAWITNVTPERITGGYMPEFWLIVGGGVLIGLLLTFIKLRRGLRRHYPDR